ncbi:MAG TPA: hypothetical protein VIY96_03745 [Thermoanaerobaculia bacterium]
MAPDRRFGLPHPLDADTSEDSSRKKPGLWESFKRALGSPAESSPAEPRPPVREPTPPRPGPPLPLPPPGKPVGAAPSPPAERPAEVVIDPPAGELLADVPFLEDLPFEDLPAQPAPSEDLSEPARTGADDTPPLSEPPLARGLASFSRDNAEREKKFAHLLRDQPSSDEKSANPPRRRR